METAGGVHRLRLFVRDGKVSSVSVDMGKPVFTVPTDGSLPTDRPMVNIPLTVAGKDYAVTCVSVGNPHCVVFTDGIDRIDLPTVGPRFEYAPAFPERINTEFVRVVNRTTLRMRVWERGNGETLACGTGACAAVAAAVRNGYCDPDADITVKLAGGDLYIHTSDQGITLTGGVAMVFEGEFEYY